MLTPGVSRGMPSGVLASAGRGNTVTINPRTQITINGAGDPYATATAVSDAMGGIWNSLVRDLAAVTR
jgi:hypothetical protein